MDEAQFKQLLQDEGYGEASTVEFEPNLAGEMHTHEFSAYVMVVRGELTLGTESGSVTHRPGEACKVPVGTVHSEAAGADGATILVGRK